MQYVNTIGLLLLSISVKVESGEISLKRLPIRKDEIRAILTKDNVYVDKTKYALKLIRSANRGKRHFFISRPNRFGKTLFVDTLEAIFKGEKELFGGTKIYSSKYKWRKYPVLRFDFRFMSSNKPAVFLGNLEKQLIGLYHVNRLPVQAGLSLRAVLENLIVNLSEASVRPKRKVVVLVDDYDFPFMENSKNLEALFDFFVALDSVRSRIHLTFVTGVYVFPLISLNVRDITTDPEFADIMGYTEDELRDNFEPHIEEFARNVPAAHMEDVYDDVSRHCEGYRFSSEPCWVYNPHSVLQYLHNETVQSEPPQFVLQEILKKPVTFRFLKDGLISVKNHQLVDIPMNRTNLPALLYQTGSLTIDEYNRRFNCCNLIFPNSLVGNVFRTKLADEFFRKNVPRDARRMNVVPAALGHLNLSILIDEMNSYFKNSVFELFPRMIKYYQAYAITFFEACGLDPEREEMPDVGILGVRFILGRQTFIVRLTVDRDPHEVLKQAIRDGKEFLDGREQEVVCVGINFNSNTEMHTWKAAQFFNSGKTNSKISVR